MSTQLGKRIRSPATEQCNNCQTSAQNHTHSNSNTRNQVSKRARGGQQSNTSNTLNQPNDNFNSNALDSHNPPLNDVKNQPEFTSKFPALNFDNVKEQLDNNAGPKKKDKLNCYTCFLTFGKEALEVKVPPQSNQAGWGRRNKLLSDLWNAKSPDERMVFCNPFFFALEKLPDLSLSNEDHVVESEDDGQLVSAPKIHQLSEANESKYLLIFNELVEIEKVHANHGKPGLTESMATMQLKSLAAFRAAHYAMFSTWADDNLKLSRKFKYYVHGKAVAQAIEKKQPQAVDAHRGELTRELNKLPSLFHSTSS
ncbi:hypothetical protein DFH28DRAFT_932176 [Melampsora americana]|nr:hypothetical protein DFH28DRAFT_932176 [Melampsora americana]